MTSTSPTAAALGLDAVEAALLARWPEHRIEPTLDRIRLLVHLLGDPHRQYASVHLTGTNGKTTTARMIDALLRAHGLRTGRLTSPHLVNMTERICVDGAPVSDAQFAAAFSRAEEAARTVEAHSPHPVSFFEMIVAMSFVAFASEPVDVAVVEVGMGGGWDATNVIDGEVSVITPISLDHTGLLHDRVTGWVTQPEWLAWS